MKLTTNQLRKLIESVVSESPEYAAVGGKVDVSAGWAQLAIESIVESMQDQDFKSMVADDIDYRSFELEDNAYFPARIEDVESTAKDIASRVVSSKEFSTAMAQFIEEAVSTAIRKGM